jgi:16S rRNA (cytidine1402-2'-O)-methyltransferase
MKSGSLFLVPITMGSEKWEHVIPSEVVDVVKGIRLFAVENIKTARRFLRKIDKSFPIDECQFEVLNKKTSPETLASLMKLLKEGNNLAVMSEAGCPCIADPGSILVDEAQKLGIHVFPQVGPSSILLALMGSGFNGQQFTFHGYLPKERKERIQQLKNFEREVRLKDITQIFMDTPYRNMNVLDDILTELLDQTKLCIASEITMTNQRIQSMTVAAWRLKKYDLNKRPTIFIIGK